jgi:hypothetical protein
MADAIVDSSEDALFLNQVRCDFEWTGACDAGFVAFESATAKLDSAGFFLEEAVTFGRVVGVGCFVGVVDAE